MRNRVLAPNERVRIAVAGTLMGGAERVIAKALKAVGLVLEVEVAGNEFVLFAARRDVTHDVAGAAKTTKGTPLDVPSSIPSQAATASSSVAARPRG
jgi:hypothetical protein